MTATDVATVLALFAALVILITAIICFGAAAATRQDRTGARGRTQVMPEVPWLQDFDPPSAAVIPSAAVTLRLTELGRAGHCAAMAEIRNPDASLTTIACTWVMVGHGEWHQNGQVRWPGRWVRPTSIFEDTVAEAQKLLDVED